MKNIIDNDISVNRNFISDPEESGEFRIGFEIWRHGNLVEDGEGRANFDGIWEETEGEKNGEERRRVVWWEFTK